MFEDILNENFQVEIDDKKYKFEFNHLAYATLERETGKSIYLFYDELISGKNLFYTDLICFVKAGMIKHHTEDEIGTVVSFLEDNIYSVQHIKNDLLMAFFKPLIVPEFINHIKKKRQVKKKYKTLKN